MARSRTAITIGSFDGVHAGHAKLIELAREHAGTGGRVVAMVFFPHPLSKLVPERCPGRLSTFGQRQDWLGEVGVDEVHRLEPTRDLLALDASAFVERVFQEHAPTAFVEGPDFRFGADRLGDVRTLAGFGRELGFETIVADVVERAITNQILVPVSSSVIRRLVAAGRVGDASALLGRAYELRGHVVRGDQRGRTIGVPTANMHTEQLLPADGVYAGDATDEHGATFAAAVHVGPRPVFDQPERVVEAHLLDCDRPIPTSDEGYGWPISLRFTHWLRDLAECESVAALQAQIARDVARVRELVMPSRVPTVGVSA